MNQLQSKRSLAPMRRQVRPTAQGNRRQSPTNNNSASIQKNLSVGHDQNLQKQPCKGYSQKYRNQNLSSIPTPLLVTLSGLTILDISHNRLNDPQIELLMNSCLKLQTLCIQGNINILIPAAIWKLKELVNFKHDWLKFLSKAEDFENQSQQRLKKIKTLVQKADFVIKINRVVGMDLETYSKQIGRFTIDNSLLQKLSHYHFSDFLKQEIHKLAKKIESNQSKPHVNKKNLFEKQSLISCNILCGFEGIRPKNIEKPKNGIRKKQSINSKQMSEAETDAGPKNIKIKDIRDITLKQSQQISSQTTQIIDKKIPAYPYSDLPFHYLMATFDSNPSSPSLVDGLLLKGYNPNIYDPKGLTPYHICLIENQTKGFDYLIKIVASNPGFFDLQMPSQHQFRNILHYCVFLKNFHATKTLIELGLPTHKRDLSGNRIIHLVDQNYEFLLLLRKILRKQTNPVRNLSHLLVNTKRKYVKHPIREKEEQRFRVMATKFNLSEMYESAVGLKIRKSSQVNQPKTNI